MRRVAIIADDLTSAMEGAGIFSRAGLKSTVAIYTPLSRVIEGNECTTVDLDSRTSTFSDARELVENATELLRDSPVIVKTMDSTLRGHLVVETRAALAKAGRSAAIIAPAFPAEGRTTRSGVQYVHDIPVECSIFSKDPTWPVRRSDICGIFRAGGFRNVIGIPTSGIRGLAHDLSRKQGPPPDVAERRIYVVDAETQLDLELLCNSIDDIDPFLWFGSVGVLTALAARIGAHCLRHDERGRMPSHETSDSFGGLCTGRKTMVVVGSVNPTSRKQLDVLRESEGVAVTVLNSSLVRAHPDEAFFEATSRFRPGRRQPKVVAVTTDGQTVNDASGDISRAIARVAAHLATKFDITDFVITGGDTSRKVLQHLGLRSIELIGEFETGMPVARCSATGGHILTKAGGFGRPDTLVRACNHLRELPRP